MRDCMVPDGWRATSLARLASYVNGFAFNEEHWSSTGLPIVRIAQITGSQGIVDRFHGHLSDAYRIDDGDIIFSWSGTLAVVRWAGGAGWLNQHLFKVIPRNGLNADLLFHILQASIDEMNKRAHGSTMKHIKRGELEEFAVVLPEDAQEQAKIADVLDTLDTTIRQTEAIIEKLKQVKQGLLHDLLTRGIDANGELRPPQSQAPQLYKESVLGWIPREWEVELLDEVAVRGSGHTPSKSVASYWNGGVKWVSLADSHRLDQIHIDTTDKEISELGIANSSAVKHPGGTVILSRDAGVGKSAVLAAEMAVSQHFMAWRCGVRLNNLYLYFRFQHMKPMFETIALGSTVKTIGLDYFKKLRIAVPERDEQDRAVEIMMDAELNIRRHQSEFDKLRLLKSGLMDDLLTGRVRVTPLLA